MAKAKPTKLHFTKEAIEKLTTNGKERAYYYDMKTPALAVCVQSSGRKAYYRTGRVNGKPKRFRLGSVDELKLSQARQLASEVSAEVSAGVDPVEERRQKRNESTLAELWKWYFNEHSKPNKRSWQRDESQWERTLKHWGGRRLSSITTAEVIELKNELAKRGHGAANKMLELLGHMYKLAPQFGYNGPDPTSSVNRFPKTERERFLEPDEMQSWFTALKTLRALPRHFFLICLLTGARRSNVAAMRWSQLNLTGGIWKIPASEFKTNKAKRIHLAPACIEVLQERKELVGDSPWVFPTRSSTGHYVEPKDAWRRLCERAGIKDLRIHDLRRTLGSWQAIAGSSLTVIGKSLGHDSIDATKVYARPTDKPVRDSVEIAVESIIEAGLSSATQEKSEKS